MTTTHTSTMTSAFSLKLLASCAVIGFGSLSAFAGTQTIDTADTMTTTLGVLTDMTGCTLNLTNVGGHGATVAIVSATDNSGAKTMIDVGANVALQINAAANLPSATGGGLTLDGGSLVPSAASITVTAPVTIKATTGGTIDLSSKGLAITPAVTTTGPLTISGANTLTLTAGTTGDGNVVIGDGTAATVLVLGATLGGTGTKTLHAHSTISVAATMTLPALTLA